MFGRILEIRDNEIIIENNSKIVDSNYLNLHVIFKEVNRSVVGEIIKITKEEITIGLLGEIKENVFMPGIIKKPSSSAEIRVIYKNELELLLGSQDLLNKDNLLIGLSSTYNNFNVTTKVSSFFTNHFAIVGNTGSGKSCGVAKIIQNLFNKEDNFPINSHIVLFDVYGEYNDAFSYLNSKEKRGYKYYSTNLNEYNNLINIPAYLLDVDDLALLLNVNSASGLPIIEKALKYVYIFKNHSEKSKMYQNSIIASCLLDILSSGKNPSQIRDQIIAVLSRYYTDDINIETPIFEPGYTRTLRQCLNIDAQGKMNSLALVVDYLKEYNRLNIDDLKRDVKVMYSLDDLYYAFEFALISEGTLNSDKAYDEYNALKVRLHQIINSDLKNYFSCSDEMITIDEFIKNLFNGYHNSYQIINMNLNYVDDRFAKTLTKIFARKFFNYAANLNERASFPIHIILEEAHRYVQNDNDINILGYNIFDRITKEGRKYGVILGLITQRPSELSVTALSQCQNFFVFKMFHPEDLKIITGITSNINKDSIMQIKNLTPGSALVFGISFKIPVIVKLGLPNPMPKSTSADILNTWF